MNVVLINPPFTFVRKSDIVFSQCLGILYIAAYLQEKGRHTVSVIDALFEGHHNVTALGEDAVRVGLDNETIVRMIPRGTDLIGVSAAFSHLAPLVHSLISDIKASRPSVPVVMGGVYPSAQPDTAAASDADFLILGEGETSMLELIEYLSRRGGGLPEGVIAKEHPASLKTASSVYVEDINTLPHPARNLIAFEKYARVSPRSQRGQRTASIITSRGCPFDCEFCSVHPTCGYRWRPRSPEDVLSEIVELVSAYNINHIEIEDDNCSIHKGRIMRILEGIVERNRNHTKRRLSWSAPNGVRIDTLDEEIMQRIAGSNCTSLNIALEHGDEEVLKIMNKRLSLNKVAEVVGLIHKYRIPANVFIIYGYPGETRERFERAVQFYVHLRKLAPHIKFYFFIAQPYPGTKLFKRCLEKGYLKENIFDSVENYRQFSADKTCWIETEDFDERELMRRKEILYKTLMPDVYIRDRVRGLIPKRLIPYAYDLYHFYQRVMR